VRGILTVPETDDVAGIATIKRATLIVVCLVLGILSVTQSLNAAFRWKSARLVWDQDPLR